MLYLAHYIKNIISTDLKILRYLQSIFLVLPLKFGLAMFQVFRSYMRPEAFRSLQHRLWGRRFSTSLRKDQENGGEGK